MGQLEKNISWISLFIALAPMLGFMGTVIGMIKAFDKIAAANDMQPSLVAGGIKSIINNRFWFDCCYYFTNLTITLLLKLIV